jgi:hypothetical protein
MAATLDLALALLIAAGPVPDTKPVCPGPRVREVEAQLGVGERFAFSGAMTTPFLHLWQQGRRPALPAPPDNVTVLAEPGLPLLILYGRHGCALGVLRASRPELFQAMRSSIGPAV